MERGKQARRVGVGALLAAVATSAWEFFGFWGNLETMRGWTTAFMSMPADFAYFLLQFLLISVGCFALALGSDPLWRALAEARRKRGVHRREREEFRKVYDFAAPEARRVVLDAVDGPVQLRWPQTRHTIVDKHFRKLDSKEQRIPAGGGSSMREEIILAELRPEVLPEARRIKRRSKKSKAPPRSTRGS